jgi:hypothetical protein
VSDTRCPRDARPDCELDHCRTCGTWHEAPTCVRCYGATARAIRDIVEYAALLPGQAIYGQNSDQHGEIQMPGGDALAMLVHGSEHATGRRGRTRVGTAPDPGPAAYSYPSDPNPPANVLLTWEDDWRHNLDMPPATGGTLGDAAAFLNRHLGWAANNHPAFDQFSHEIRKVARALEQVLHAGIRDEIGVRCIRCNQPPRLRAKFVDVGHQPTPLDVEHHVGNLSDDQGGRRDWWECPKCHEIYSPEEYLLAAGDDMAKAEL